MSGPVSLVAVDLGASSGRVILGRVGTGVLELEEVHRFRNGPVRLPDGLYWDVLGLYQDVLEGLRTALRRAASSGSPVAGLAIDSWAVDYGLLDPGPPLVVGTGPTGSTGYTARLAGNPRHYRDPRTGPAIEAVHARISAPELYAVSGMQFLPFNTLYQFAAEPDLDGLRALLIPDLLGYWLTGVQVAEETNASTTGLLDARTGDWSNRLLAVLDLPRDLLAPVRPAGSVLGPLTAAVQEELGLVPGDPHGSAGLTVTTVGSHDTASAVVGIPADGPDFAYISCGTWGLVGLELDAPVLTEASRTANFTNERGIDGTIRYLSNVMGLWLLSESLRTWSLHGADVDLAGALDRAAELPDGGPRIDPDDPVFLPPGDMPSRIAAACRASGQPQPQTVPEVVRCILDSLAAAFARRIAQAEELTRQSVEVVHLVGGGSRNALLCRLTADACGRPVVAGPVEATAIGNLLVQARTHGAIAGDVWTMRALARAALDLTRYEPRKVGAR
jgi:rhamnulokinase